MMYKKESTGLPVLIYKFGRRDWNRTNDLYHVKVAL
jgi:hypothetical protein